METADDPTRAEIRAYLRRHPELTLADIIAGLMRGQTADDPYTRSSVAAAWAGANRDINTFWALLEQQDPATAEALKDAALAPIVLEVARQERPA